MTGQGRPRASVAGVMRERYDATWEHDGSRASVAWSLPPMGDDGERGEKWRRVLPLVAVYAEAFDAGEPIETVLVDMVADLLHLLHAQGANEHAADDQAWDVIEAVERVLEMGVVHFLDEHGREVAG